MRLSGWNSRNLRFKRPLRKGFGDAKISAWIFVTCSRAHSDKFVESRGGGHAKSGTPGLNGDTPSNGLCIVVMGTGGLKAGHRSEWMGLPHVHFDLILGFV